MAVGRSCLVAGKCTRQIIPLVYSTAPNVMLVQDPSEMKRRIYIVMLDAASYISSEAAQDTGGDVFAEVLLPRPNLTNFRDLGGVLVQSESDGVQQLSIRWGAIFRHGRLRCTSNQFAIRSQPCTQNPCYVPCFPVMQ